MDGGLETYVRDRRGFAAAPTHHGLTMVIVGWPYAEFAENKQDIEGNYLKTIELAPAFAERLRRARRETRFTGVAVPNYSASPTGLVGIGGRCGLQQGFHYRASVWTPSTTPNFARMRSTGPSPERNRSRPRWPLHGATGRTGEADYEFTCQLAALEPPPAEMQQLFGAIHGNHKAMEISRG